MSSTTMSHAPMRAALALSVLAEIRRDEPREVIETACHGPVGGAAYARYPRLGNPRCNSAARDYDDQIRGLATRTRIDAVAGRTRVRRVGGEPCGWSRCGAAFRWIFLPVALYRRLPADPGILLPRTRPGFCATLRLDVTRLALGPIRFHRGSPILRAHGRRDRSAFAGAIP